MPDASGRGMSGCASGRQPLKSPTTDTLGVRRPDRKVSARSPRAARGCALDRVGTELFVCAEVRAFTEEIDVLFRQHGLLPSKRHARASRTSIARAARILRVSDPDSQPPGD